MNELMTVSRLEQFVTFVDRPERTTKGYTKALQMFAAYLSYMHVEQPTRADVMAYREWLMTERPAIAYDAQTGYKLTSSDKRAACTVGTVRTYLTAIKQYFQWTAAAGIYPNISYGVNLPKANKTHKKDSLTPADVAKILQTMQRTGEEQARKAEAATKDRAGRIKRAKEQTQRDICIFKLAVTAGLRTCEISRLKAGDLEIKGNKAGVWVWGKGHAEADTKQPISAQVAREILAYLKERGAKPGEPMFTPTGNRGAGHMDAATISRMLKSAMRAAGYDSARLTAHSLRHTAIQTALEVADGNVYDAQLVARHASPAVTENYLEQSARAKRSEALAQMIADEILDAPQPQAEARTEHKEAA